MGQEEEALKCLEDAKKNHWLNYRIQQHPSFENLKGNEKFKQIIKEVKAKSDSLKLVVHSIESTASL